MTPLEYMRNYLKTCLTIISSHVYAGLSIYTYAELEVEDNWWKSKDYCIFRLTIL
jgi:hypothetical protein